LLCSRSAHPVNAKVPLSCGQPSREEQTEGKGGLGDKLDDNGERMHQVWSEHEKLSKSVPCFKRRTLHQIKRQRRSMIAAFSKLSWFAAPTQSKTTANHTAVPRASQQKSNHQVWSSQATVQWSAAESTACVVLFCLFRIGSSGAALHSRHSLAVTRRLAQSAARNSRDKQQQQQQQQQRRSPARGESHHGCTTEASHAPTPVSKYSV